MKNVNANLDLVRSAGAGMVWPAVTDNADSMALAMQHQLEQTQWWMPAELERHQIRPHAAGLLGFSEGAGKWARLKCN